MQKKLPLWRSMLFVPANVQKFVGRSHERGADAIILDLEDSVPLSRKADARQALADAARQAGMGGADVVVRINAPLRLAARDLEVAINPAVSAICVPKASSPGQLQWISEAIGELEVEKGLPAGHTRMIALIESTAALACLQQIASSTPRLAAMVLGSEDFSASAGMEPEADGLLFPNQQVLFAARSAGILPLGYVGSIAQFTDLARFRETIRRSRNLGFRGGFCVHPDQVSILNEEFSPSPGEVADARAILDVYEQALGDNRGATEYRGKMIDAPVVARAREVLESHRRIAGE